MGLLESILNIFYNMINKEEKKNDTIDYDFDDYIPNPNTPVTHKNRFDDLKAVPKQVNGSNIRISSSEIKKIIQEQTGCSNITFGDSEYDLMSDEYFKKYSSMLGTHHLKYLKSYKFQEEFDKIDKQSYIPESQKEEFKNKIRKEKNFDCENFAILFSGLWGVIDGSLTIGKCEGKKVASDGSVSAHAFNIYVNENKKVVFCEPQTLGTWKPETNKWEIYSVNMN